MVQGVEQLRKKLTVDLVASVEQATRAAMETSADELVAMMKRLVPVDTGALRESIGWTWGSAPKGSVVVAESAADSRGLKITVYAGTRDKSLGDADAFYARFVEFGTVKMAAEPFFFVSYRSLRKRIKSRITREMKKAVQEGFSE